MRTLLLPFLAVFLFSACSTHKKYNALSKYHSNNYTIQEHNTIKQRLYQSYKKWAGVHYCYGGADHSGIDCSALVQQIYKEAFHLNIPRTTKQQITIGTAVVKKDLKEGDLLFFKTSYKGLHSGIYLQNGDFIHSSSKYGVTLSNLKNPYWKKRYYKARRLINHPF